jgi:hypothetical protein
MAFFLGEVTRDANDAAAITAALLERGYQTIPGPPPEQQLDLVNDGEELSFVWLAMNSTGQVVLGGGPYAGEPWPEGMLTWDPGHIGRLRCPIISPQAQIEIKEMMPVWVPGFPRRAKDTEDVARLRAALRS